MKKFHNITHMLLHKPTVLFLFSLFISSFNNLFSQQRSAFFGKRNLISIEKDFAPIRSSSYDVEIKSTIFPRIKLERMISKRATLGISYTRINHTFDERSYYVINEAPVIKHKGGYVRVYNFSGPFRSTNNDFILHLKKFYRSRSMSPLGLYRIWEVGLSQNQITVDTDYKFYDDKNVAYNYETKQKIKYEEFIIGFSLGKVAALYKDKLLLDVSLGTGFKLSDTIYGSADMDHFVNVANLRSFNLYLLKLKMGISYPF